MLLHIEPEVQGARNKKLVVIPQQGQKNTVAYSKSILTVCKAIYAACGLGSGFVETLKAKHANTFPIIQRSRDNPRN